MNRSSDRRTSFFDAFLGILAICGLAAIAGCSGSGNYPVRGKVVDTQGQPVPGLEGSQIVFTQVEGVSSSVADIAADGSFDAFTMRPGDGVPPGKYTVHIPRKMIDPERAAPQVIHGKYEKPETSGLEATVEEKKNELEFKVERASGRGA